MKEHASFERPSYELRERGSFTARRTGVCRHAGALPPMRDDLPPTGSAWRAGSSTRTTRSPRASRSTASGSRSSAAASSRPARTSARRASRPRIPELLDWLATEFVANGLEPEGAAPDDRDVGHLPAVVGDPAALAERDPTTGCSPAARASGWKPRWSATHAGASGLLSPKMDGPSVFPPQPDGIWNMPYSATSGPTSRARIGTAAASTRSGAARRRIRAS